MPTSTPSPTHPTETDWRNGLAAGDRIWFPDGWYAGGRERPFRSAQILERLFGGWARVRFDDTGAVETHTLKAAVSRVEAPEEPTHA